MTAAASPEDARTSAWDRQTLVSFRTNCTTFQGTPRTLDFALTQLLPLPMKKVQTSKLQNKLNKQSLHSTLRYVI